MLGGFHTDLLVTATLLFLTQTGTQCRAEIDTAPVTLPDWRRDSEYVTQCAFGSHSEACDWTMSHSSASEAVAVDVIESGALDQGEACLEFWYLATSDASALRALIKSSTGLVEIWTSPVATQDSWRQVFVPLNIIESGTKVLLEAAVPLESQVTFNHIGVRRGSCGHQCDSNTELWTDEFTRCLCSEGHLSCSPSQCPKGQICGRQRRAPREISKSGMCTIHSNTDCSTFDGVLFRFMTPCNYILAKTCSPSEALPTFSVEVVNGHDGNSSIPTVQRVIVYVGNERVSLLKRQTHRVVVNGVWRNLPLGLSSNTVKIKSNPAAVALETSFGLFVTYDSAGDVHITLPSAYSHTTCGLCGNFNHRREDDFMKPDGTPAFDATALANSWQSGETNSTCETLLVPHQCAPLEEAEYAGDQYCGGLLSRTGPFATCQSFLGAESYFRGCVNKMCSAHGDPSVLCETLQMYADICKEAGVTVPTWWNSTICSPQCGENSHYNSCARGCPDVCSNRDLVGPCGSCEERCECDYGFKLSGGKCVLAEDCGCWHDGNHYERGERFVEGECVQQCHCLGGNNIQCIKMQCASNEVCKVESGVKGCFASKPATCSVYGDPHYITFDGMAYDFQGGCSYTLATTCGGQSAVHFTVIGHNIHPPLHNFTRSKLQATTLQIGGVHITLNQSTDVYVNNSRVLLPYSTTASYGMVWVYKNTSYVVMETTFGLKMMIDGQNRFFLQVDERYKYELCGLCGTYSEQQDDDFIQPSGQNATDPFEFGDSWKVPHNNECVSHPNDPQPCENEEENEAYAVCYAILGDAFKPCHETIHPSIYISSCVYDYCTTSGDRATFCESLESYAAACQVGGVDLPDWQSDSACDEPRTTEDPPATTPSSTLEPDLCPINCDFEKNLCGWQQLIQDSFDWTRYSGATPTNGSGPNHDHTTGAGFYLYIEGDSVTHGDPARLLSPECHYNAPVCLNFWYHMYGSATAMALNMYLIQGNKATKIWSMKNNQGQDWHPGKIDINVSSPFQIIVEGIRGSDALSDVAIDDISIHFGACSSSLGSGNEPPLTAEVLPSEPVCRLNCSFDSGFCRWNQMRTDAFDWTWQSGSTPTLMTGPSADHTGDGRYLYIEASSVSHGDTARLISSECSATGPQCLQFWYHMYGSADTMGLHLYLLQGKKADVIWWKRNDQGNKWHLAQVDLTVTRAFQIIIEGRRGSNEESDVAIDDVTLYHGQCSELSGVVTTYPPRPDGNATAPPHVTLPVTAVTELPAVNVTDQFPDTAWPPVANATLPPIIEATTDFIKNVTEAGKNIPQTSVCPINCDFEKNLCGWQQLIQDSFDWTRYSGATPTNGSGPNHDHTTGAGFYLYIEGDSVTHGDPARLLSPECHYNGPGCLNFWYHMYGSATAMALNVYLIQGNKATKIWSMKNNQGQDWHPGKIDINVSSPFQITVEGIRGSDALSDVAIDDISIHFGTCSSSLGSGNEPPSTAEVLPSEPVCRLNCSFDSGFCRWNQMRTDAFDWTWQSGSTPTLMTGPSADHTGDGRYLYIEASSVSHGDTARLISSECSATGPQCLQFWYHMYGSADTMGLHLYLLQGKKADAIWWKRNDQGNKWHLAQVDLTVTRAFQIIIEGRRGSNEESDVAIDDVTLYHGQCSGLSGVVTTYPPRPDGNATAPPHVTLPVTAVTELPAVNVTVQFPDTAWPPVANATLPPIIEATTDFIKNVTEAGKNIPQNSVCPINCDFEKNLCGWQQLIQDSFDWTRYSGATPTNGSGPNHDHTTGAGFYLYIEGDSVTHGDPARLLSPECHYNGPVCLNFWYHMYGSATAMALNVYLIQGNKATKIWSMKNNQGQDWHPGKIDINVSSPFQITVEGIRGSDALSDVAIDDISIHFGSLGSGNEPPSTAEVLPSEPVCRLNCSFDSGFCRWNQMRTDAFDWTWQSGSTPTLMTGPSADHTGDGRYLYIEASRVSHGDTARLISSECSATGPQCLQFWYHMYGSADTMGLHLYLLQGKKADVIWWKRNDQGNKWHLAQVDLTVIRAFQIIIEGRRGSNEESDVAIDDVTLYHGQCSELSGVVTTYPPRPDGNTTAPPHVTLPVTAVTELPAVNVTDQFPVTAWPPVANATLPPIIEATTDFIAQDKPQQSECQLSCNFEKDLCQWSQLLADAFDWTRHSGRTASIKTGPSSDHTTGHGHYLYTEANGVSHGDTARLISSKCSATGPQCLQFWYHMYGSADTMGLHVYLLQGKKADAIWWKRNDQGNHWRLAQVDLTVTRPFQIIIEGRRGSNEESDVAIDDVTLYHGQCSELSNVTTHPPIPDENATVPAVTQLPAVNVTDPTYVTAGPPVANVTLPPIIETTTDSIMDGNVTVAEQNKPSHSVCQLNCNFDQDLCQWSQLLTDVFDWTRHSGPTPTIMTGPSSDHTTENGHYLYIEANSASHGDTARLISSKCSASGPKCLQFWYHMYGSADTMGLHVYLLQDKTADAILMMRNNQGNVWRQAQVDITTAGHFQILFEGRRGSNDRSDVAIDDISLYRGRCADLTNPTLPPPITTDLVTDIISNITQPQNTNSTSTTTDTTGSNTQTTTRPKTPNPNASTTTPAAPVTIGPQTTATAFPSSTDHQVDEGTEEPGPEPTAEEITTAITYPKTSARPLPTGSHPQTSVKPETPPGTVTQPPTTATPQAATTNEQQSASTVKPQHPNGTQAATTTAGSTPPCPQHSHYSACISACGPTCRYVNGPPGCNDTEDCEPGCVCDDGYVLRRGVCVPVQQCGCVDRDGNKYSFGQEWYTSHCSHKCQCQRQDGLGEIDCDEDECDNNAVCLQSEEGHYYCQKTGFDRCLINGDPQYRTFDNMKHDFEGEHSYVLVRTKNLPSNLPDVYIEGNNTPIKDDEDNSSEEEDDGDDDDDENDGDDDENDGDNNSNEDDEHHRLQGLTVKVYNHTVEFKKGQKLFVDGQRTKTPVSPSLGLKIQKHSSHIYVNTDFGLAVKFDGRSDAEITLPRVYKRKVGGLCGNFDGRMLNDRMRPDGTMAKTVQEFGDSWRV
ncbi:MAM and LDL-receptor class A domain-containing protein 1-like isoform X2 [Dunckerocampus dactyliophorus]|uniref:MAM and LDL-receptor class A domain-containing protein 1-like isoform X2 n=1 Tax=Dunckerocampus dactyliophorus TaxID=161453 RepID=UPI0024049935|nr:MAM and LDL-receptor class A domain-containing protein 1-like isoform X2 [Dunckerocampus dactyliophorus]